MLVLLTKATAFERMLVSVCDDHDAQQPEAKAMGQEDLNCATRQEMQEDLDRLDRVLRQRALEPRDRDLYFKLLGMGFTPTVRPPIPNASSSPGSSGGRGQVL